MEPDDEIDGFWDDFDLTAEEREAMEDLGDDFVQKLVSGWRLPPIKRQEG